MYKSRPRENSSNYRGISHVNVLYKIFSNIVNNRLYRWVDTFDLIDENQADFRHGYSVIDNLFTLQSVTQKYICKPSGRFYVLYVDFQKLFDSIVHNKLFSTLHSMALHANIFKLLLSMYSNLKSSVRVGNKRSESLSCNIGTNARGRKKSNTFYFIYTRVVYLSKTKMPRHLHQ